MTADTLTKYFDRISDAPNAMPRLRRFILDLAVRGKLVEQDPSDEPANELLKRIRVEKARLVRSGKAEKDKSLVCETNITFAVPKGWGWAKVGQICSKTGSGSTPRGGKEAYISSGVPFLRSQNIHDDGLRLDAVAYIADETHQRMKGTAVLPGDLLLNITGGSIGRCTRVPDDFIVGNISQHVAILRLALNDVIAFVHLTVMSPYFQDQVLSSQTGAGREGLPKNRMDQIAIPIPPLAEQRRIVAKVGELMALCDQLEVARKEREVRRDRLVEASLQRMCTAITIPVDARFYLDQLPQLTIRKEHIKQLRQTILNLAVRGCLVSQDDSDEQATELLQKIQVERDSLVKCGRIRKATPLSPIATDNLPFALPDNWKWAKIGDAALSTEYGTSQQSSHSDLGVPVLKMGDIQGGKVLLGGQKKVSATIDDLPSLYLEKFDLLYNRTNSAELVGKTGIYTGPDYEYTFASYLIRIKCSQVSSNPKYLNLAMNAPFFRETQIVPHLKQQCGQANVNGTILKNMLVPFPPLAEQHRIVAKVDALMTLCDQLEVLLVTAETDSRRLLEAVLRDALTPPL